MASELTFRRKPGIGGIALVAIVVIAWFASDNFRALVYFGLRGAYFAVHSVPPACKERAARFNAKVDNMERNAKNALRVGTRKDDVVRFFASEKIPLAFNQVGQDHEATGTISLKGLAQCENFACADDSTFIGVRVNVDADGTVVSDPVVVGGYANCL